MCSHIYHHFTEYSNIIDNSPDEHFYTISLVILILNSIYSLTIISFSEELRLNYDKNSKCMSNLEKAKVCTCIKSWWQPEFNWKSWVAATLKDIIFRFHYAVHPLSANFVFERSPNSLWNLKSGCHINHNFMLFLVARIISIFVLFLFLDGKYSASGTNWMQNKWNKIKARLLIKQLNWSGVFSFNCIVNRLRTKKVRCLNSTIYFLTWCRCQGHFL